MDHPVPVLDGQLVPYVNLDNAASTPALRSVVEAVEEFLPFYASVHRGTGYKSRLSTDGVRAGARHRRRLRRRRPRARRRRVRQEHDRGDQPPRAVDADADGAVVLTTVLEHHSNDLPWRARAANAATCRARPDGTLDVDDLDALLAEHAGRVALLAVPGASNVTGVVPARPPAGREGARGRRPDPGRRRPAGGPPPDRHASARRSRSPRLRRAVGAQDVRPVRHRRARRASGPVPSVQPDHAGGGTVRAVTVDDVRLGRPTRPRGGGQPQRGRRRRPRRRHPGADDARPRPHRRPRGRAHPLRHGCGWPVSPACTFHGPVEFGADRDPGSASSRSPSTASTTAWSPRCSATSTASACARVLLRPSLRRPPARTRAGARSAGGSTWSRGGEHRGAPGMVRISLGCYNDTTDIDRAVRRPPMARRRRRSGDLPGGLRRVVRPRRLRRTPAVRPGSSRAQ